MKKVIGNVGKNIGVILLSIVVLAIGQIVQGLAYKLFSQYYLQLIISSTIRIVTTVVLAWLVSSKLLKMDAKELGLKIGKTEIKYMLISVGLPVFVLVFYAYILPGKAYIAKPGEFVKSLITAFFSVGITAGICEEVIFRGMIFRYMKKTLGTKAAIIVPSVLFACVHITNMETFDVVDLLILLLAGSSVAVMFTMFTYVSDSLLPGALTHTLWNTLIIGGFFGIGEIVNGTANESYIIIPIMSSSKFLTGGNFGVEAAIPASVGYILATVLIIIISKKHTAKEKIGKIS